MTADEQAVTDALARYQDALNRSDADAAVAVYAADGVFMPQHSPSSVGTAAVRRAYEAVFGTITLAVTFDVTEVRQVAPDWVIARTNSHGTATVNATQQGGPEANQELFALSQGSRCTARVR